MDRRRGARIALASLPLIGAGGCTQVFPLSPVDGACIPATVQAAFDRSCATGGCHDATAAAGLRLDRSGSASVLERDATQVAMPLVVIGDSAQSYLALKLMADPPEPIVGARMPAGTIDADRRADMATILAWVGGAPAMGCGDGGTSGGTSGGDGGTPTDLPCEIEDLLAARCRSCHGDPPVGAPMAILGHDDLVAGTPTDPQVSVAQRSLERMMDTTSPMPPLPAAPATADEIAALGAWIDAGMPVGSCESTDPFAVDPVCTSGKMWSGEEGPRMAPGRDCIACHASTGEEEAPDYIVAGTIYPTGHEPDACNGLEAADLRVVVRSIDSGAEVSLALAGAGNFGLRRSQAPAGFSAPFSVAVQWQGRERLMSGPAPSGACNACHTQDGANEAPGRVVAP
ncbi:MAG: hypothetical protein U0168_18290 [Nannocystaceae bacterium]